MGRGALATELRELAGDLIERVLDGLEALGNRAQAPGKAVDIVAGREVEVPEGAGARLGGALPRPERNLQSLVHPGVVDQQLGEVTQRSLASPGTAITFAFAAALVHIVHARYRDG
jgi:hypothetical protein